MITAAARSISVEPSPPDFAGFGCAAASIDGDHAARLRAGSPPVVARVHEGWTICDLRTVDPADDAVLTDALTACTS